MYKDRRAILFDLDGTLVDSAADLTASLNHTLAQDALPALTRQQVIHMLGDGAPVMIERAYTHHGSHQPADALERYRSYYREHCLDATRPFPGIAELLRRLSKNRTLAVATNKPVGFAEQLIEGLGGLRDHFAAVTGPETANSRKPEPDMLLAALAAIGHQPGDAVMIGDSGADIGAGRRAGIPTIGVLWGYRSRDHLEASGADHLAASVEELGSLLMSSKPVAPS